ncbi:MAG: malate/lactate/ureidoglycolate dehydrogenase [Desulfuromonadaceae bacterium]|nr:malate/lactate/ureidoglycolate dehydrogenase [Desulfuromonadaceae bacterium]
MIISALNLKGLLLSILRQSGSDEYESELVADHLVRANLSGHDSHGAGMLPTYIKNLKAGLLIPGNSVSLVSDNGSILVFDGQRGYGQRVATEAMNAAIERCRSTGLTIAALRNAHHIGRVGSYGEQCAAAGLVSLHFVNVIDHAPLVAPFGSREARLATNPLCMALPATAETTAAILDMATSKVALGKARVAMNRGEQLAPGLLLDPQGEPTTEPGVMFQESRGALLPVGEHKGYGLAFFCELLAGVLTGGGTIQPERPRLGGIINNMLTFLVDPQRLVEHNWMETEINAVVRYMKESKPVGIDVMVAGDPERKKRAERKEQGITVEDTTWEELMKAGSDVGLSRQELEGFAKA